MIDIQTVSIVIAAEKTRQTELMMQLFGPFRDFELLRHYFEIVYNWDWTDYDDYVKKYAQKDTEYSKFVHVSSFFNTLGLLVRMKLIDLETIVKWHPEATLWFWEKMEPIIKEAEKRMIASGKWRMKHRPFEWLEYLYNEMKKTEQQLASKTA